MSRRERKRLEVFSRVKIGAMTLFQASSLLGLSYRQTKRVWSRYQEDGDAGLVHQGRGRASNRQTDDALKEQALALYREQYSDYGPTLAAETMGKEDNLQVSVSVLRRWLQGAGLWERRRKRRERRTHVGELLQLDGSVAESDHAVAAGIGGGGSADATGDALRATGMVRCGCSLARSK